MFKQRKNFFKTGLAIAISILTIQSAKSANFETVKCGEGYLYSDLLVPTNYRKIYSGGGICIYNKDHVTLFIADIKSGALIQFYRSRERQYPNTFLPKQQKEEVLLPTEPLSKLLKDNDPYNKVMAIVSGNFAHKVYNDLDYRERGYLLFMAKANNTFFSKGVSMDIEYPYPEGSKSVPSPGMNFISDFRSVVFYGASVRVKNYERSDYNLTKHFMVGLRPDYERPHMNIRQNDLIPRTFAGSRNGDTSSGNGYHNFFIMAVTKGSSAAEMTRILSDDWLVHNSNIVMLGSGEQSKYIYHHFDYTGDAIEFNSESSLVPIAFGFRRR